MDWPHLTLYTLAALGALGLCMMITAAVLIALQGGWRRAIQQPMADGQASPPRRSSVGSVILRRCVCSWLDTWRHSIVGLATHMEPGMLDQIAPIRTAATRHGPSRFGWHTRPQVARSAAKNCWSIPPPNNLPQATPQRPRLRNEAHRLVRRCLQ